MKIYSKRFCVDCDGERGMYVIRHKNYAMYHCCECRQEVARVGDALGLRKPTLIAGGDTIRRDAGFEASEGITPAAQANPDILSDEHALWQHRDAEHEATREDGLRTLRVAMVGLTARQKQVLEAVRVHKTQSKAAVYLGISQPVVKKTLNRIAKILSAKGIKLPNRG